MMRGGGFEEWVASVANGAATMSQRNLNWVEANGGIDTLVEVARHSGVHLVKLVDDKGHELVAASRERFETLC